VTPTFTRCDLHLHSAASVGSDEWYTRFFGCPESYAEPARQYELCKARGMSLVTLTDHDTIAGGLQLLDRPDFFLSEEITAVFPENGCVMHVLAWNITPAQHEAIQERRQDIYRLSEYLNGAGIAHGLAHPLLSPNWKLDADVLEKVLLLFPTFEAVNGLTDRRIEPDLEAILERLTPEVIAALSAKHGLRAVGERPHRKALTGGSDDHAHRRAGSVYTVVEQAAGGEALAPPAFLARCMAGEGAPVGHQAHLDAMAMLVKHTTYHHFKQRAQDGGDGARNPFVDIMDLIAGREPAQGSGAVEPPPGLVASLLAGAERAALDLGEPYDILAIPAHPSEEDDARVMGGIARLVDRVVERALEELLAGAQDFDLYRIFAALRDLAGGLVPAAPLFFAADHFAKQERGVRRVFDAWTAFPLPPRLERLAVFTDAPARGVSRGRPALVPYCGPRPELADDAVALHALPALTSFSLPLGSLASLHVPSLVDTLQWAWREGVTRVELATPGPMGLSGLLVAKVLRLPVTTSEVEPPPALLGALAGNPMIERAARRYLAWFYGRAVLTPAVAAAAPSGGDLRLR
jgi:hypothetical protein